MRRCNPCPVVKPTFLCGTDNRTYSSLCRLDYHNCIHHTAIRVACKGFCPCKEGELHLRKKQRQSERLNNLMNKYKMTAEKEKKQQQQNQQQQQDLYAATNPPYSDDKDRQRGYNEVLDTKPSINHISSNSWSKDCPPSALQAMGNRLLDWFSVLSLQELYDLEHDQSEKCIKPFLDACDADHDIFVSPREWCRCFEKTDRPCAAVKRRISPDLLGVYIPDCDDEGYYRPTQCHTSVGMCWCVDKHGVEMANSRTRGKPNCGGKMTKSSFDKHCNKNTRVDVVAVLHTTFRSKNVYSVDTLAEN
ncbi:hypothetical protein C0J52_11955 [Blattella germanica]|nr:hypothetical protein C0J52_11955 [Blattella germanica]